MTRTILITGASGNIGTKLASYLPARGYTLRLLDKTAAEGVLAADLGQWDETWAAHFEGVDTVVHLAGDPRGQAPWNSALRNNINATQHVLRAARNAKVRRVLFASTNQVMLGYRFQSGPVRVDMPPAPLSPYGISKLACEELGRAFVEETGADFLAMRIGYFQRGDNLPGPHMLSGAWGQSMWLSNRDMMQAVEKAIEAPPFGFETVFLMSDNAGMRWDIEHTRKVIGYVPLDSATPVMTEEKLEEDRIAAARTIVPGQWFDEHFHTVEP
jgi:NAD+ dependent glucose-6-phosphate dehydrogenase